MSRSSVTAISVAILLGLAVACSRQSSSPTSPSSQGSDGSVPAAADGSTLKATPPTPASPVNDQQVGETPTLSATRSSMKFADGPLTYRFQVFNEAGAMVQDSGVMNGPSFRVTARLDFRKRYTWRARAEYQGAFGPWSAAASFVSPEGGYIRGNEVFDPLFNGATVGERIGPTTFVAGRGIRLESNQSYVRYLIPQTISSGEFSMEVEGLAANAPGDKSKVFGMQEGTDDYIVNPYRVDIQYRGTGGFPPNAITFRALYGSADDLDVRYEPDTGTRLNSAIPLNPATTYFWKATWGSEVRVTVREGGINGRVIYDHGVRSPNGTYAPRPHYAFIGTPTGRSGAESASIPGTIYRNVYIGARPRPQ
ncbi:MAG: hypothetical protein GEU82_10880 [Luteitalea sp.]|nr:hypothetical protein [Luteitalea sp.]